MPPILIRTGGSGTRDYLTDTIEKSDPIIGAANVARRRTPAWWPREKYILFCAGCHGFQGEGGGGGGGTEPVAPLTPGLGVFLRDPVGRAYLVNVGGVSSAGMSSAETAIVLNYILQEMGDQKLPADFEPYSAAEIEALRRRPMDDPVATRKEMRRRLLARGYRLPPYQWER